MATKVDFQYEEWCTLQAVFCTTVLNVAMADHEISDAEAKAWHNEREALSQSVLPLVRELLLEDAGSCINDDVASMAANTAPAVLLVQAGRILHAKATAHEIKDYKRSVRSLAVAVADGSPGGDREENRFLADLNDWLIW